MNKLAIIVGSLRRDSINRKLAEATAVLASKDLTIDWVKLDDVPMYNGDLEANLPGPVKRIKDQIKNADAVLLVTPEYNRSIPPLLKNAIDWASRPYGASVWGGKPVAIMGATPGAIGTAAAQQHLRNVLAAVGAVTLPQPEMFITYKDGMIDDKNEFADARTKEFVLKFVQRISAWVEQVDVKADTK